MIFYFFNMLRSCELIQLDELLLNTLLEKPVEKSKCVCSVHGTYMHHMGVFQFFILVRA